MMERDTLLDLYGVLSNDIDGEYTSGRLERDRLLQQRRENLSRGYGIGAGHRFLMQAIDKWKDKRP